MNKQNQQSNSLYLVLCYCTSKRVEGRLNCVNPFLVWAWRGTGFGGFRVSVELLQQFTLVLHLLFQLLELVGKLLVLSLVVCELLGKRNRRVHGTGQVAAWLGVMRVVCAECQILHLIWLSRSEVCLTSWLIQWLSLLRIVLCVLDSCGRVVLRRYKRERWFWCWNRPLHCP